MFGRLGALEGRDGRDLAAPGALEEAHGGLFDAAQLPLSICVGCPAALLIYVGWRVDGVRQPRDGVSAGEALVAVAAM